MITPQKLSDRSLSHRHLPCFLVFTSAVAIVFVTSTTVVAEPPNIILIVADDLGWGDLGCYGNQYLPTPHIDRLAARGSLFTQFYVNGSVCSPSRAAILTGCFPGRLGIHGHLASDKKNRDRVMPNFLDPKLPTIADLLKQSGYATAHIGKWHLGHSTDAPTPEEYGFDLVRSSVSSNNTWDEHTESPYFRAHSTKIFVDEGIKFIHEKKDGPFFLNLWTLVPHAPLNPTNEQMKPFQKLGTNPVQHSHKAARTIYYASVADLDKQVGRLLKALDESRVAENTIVIFTSDNGPEDIFIPNAGHSGVGSQGPFRGRKRSLYEGGIRVPFIVRWPAGAKESYVDDTSVISGADLLPTLCRLAKVPLHNATPLDGEDRSQVLRGVPKERAKPLFWEWRYRIYGHVSNFSPVLAVRQGDWKLLFNPDGSRTELYHIPEDPGEFDNRANDHSEVVEQLKAETLAWQEALPKGSYHQHAGVNTYPWPSQPE